MTDDLLNNAEVKFGIDENGHANLKSLKLSDFLEVPELRYNRISVVSGETWNAPGGGIIEDVNSSERWIMLRLEKNEAATVMAGDLCKGIYCTENGFDTCFFKITSVEANKVMYELRPGYSTPPYKGMHFVAYGNINNGDRQNSVYQSKSAIRFLSGVNDWNHDMYIVMQMGDLSGLTIPNQDMSGYSAYLKNIYMTGTIKQLSGNGAERALPFPKGNWNSGITYYPNDEVVYIGNKWLCKKECLDETPAENEFWVKQNSYGDYGSIRMRGNWSTSNSYRADGEFRDVVLFGGNYYIAKIDISGESTNKNPSLESSKWEVFNEFQNVATDVLLANKGNINVLGAGRLFVGRNELEQHGWEMTEGEIRHTTSGLKLTSDGKLSAPPGGITFNNTTVEQTIKDQVDAIQIGGRNLFLKSNRKFEGNTWNIPTSVNLANCIGKEISVSCDVIVENVTSSGRIGIEIFIIHTDGDQYGIGAWKQMALAESAKLRLQGKGLIKDKPIRDIQYKGCFVQLSANNAYIERPKLEFGNKPTDWSPAPEDVADQIDNIHVGGRNLIRNTKCSPLDGYWRHRGWADASLRPYYDAAERSLVFRARDGWVHFGTDFPYNTKECVVSFEYKIKTLTGDIAFNCALMRAPEYGSNVLEFTPTREWQKASLVTLWQSNYIGFTLYNPDHNTNVYEVYIRDLKVELGNKPTDWSPAPEDIDYLTEAMKGDTNIRGGLVMSNVMAVRSGTTNTEEDIVAGMSGLKDDGVFFFADVKNAYRKAVSYFKDNTKEKPMFGVSKKGKVVSLSGLIGCFNVDNDNITIRSGDEDKVRFTPESIETFGSGQETSSGGNIGREITHSTRSVSLEVEDSFTALSYSFNVDKTAPFTMHVNQVISLHAEARADSISDENWVEADAAIDIEVRLEIKSNGRVIHDQLVGHENFMASANGLHLVDIENRDLAIEATMPLILDKGLVEVRLYGNYVASLFADELSGADFQANSSAHVDITPRTGKFTFVANDGETIIGSDGLSVRQNSQKLFKLLKTTDELLLSFKGKVDPSSNIPHLICGGEVNAKGNPVYQLGDDSFPLRESPGYYKVLLPAYMKGKENYIVQLTGVATDNVVVMHSKNINTPCFYVQTLERWEREDTPFTYMVYLAREKNK